MNKADKPVRVIVADDHTLVRAGICALLEKIPGVVVVGEANDGREAINQARLQRPHVVLMDISMTGLNGLEATIRILKDFPEIRVLILSMHNNEDYCWRALKAGAAGYLLKKAVTAELETALHRVVSGEIYLSREISTRFLRKFRSRGMKGEESPLERLTERQREILQLIAEGQNTKHIAALLKVSPKTIEYHRKKLMTALNMHDVPGLVRFALRVGLVPQES